MLRQLSSRIPQLQQSFSWSALLCVCKAALWRRTCKNIVFMKRGQRLTTLGKNVGTLGLFPPPPDSSIITLKNFPKLCFFIKTTQRGEGTAQCISNQSEVSHVFLTGLATRKVRPRTITSGFCFPCFKVRAGKAISTNLDAVCVATQR